MTKWQKDKKDEINNMLNDIKISFLNRKNSENNALLNEFKHFIQYMEKKFFDNQYGFYYDSSEEEKYYTRLVTRKKVSWHRSGFGKVEAKTERSKGFSAASRIIEKIIKNKEPNNYCFYMHYVKNSKPELICFESLELLLGFVFQSNYLELPNYMCSDDINDKNNEESEGIITYDPRDWVETIPNISRHAFGYKDGKRQRTKYGRLTQQGILLESAPEKLYREADGELAMQKIHIDAFRPMHLYNYLDLIITDRRAIEIFPYLLFMIYSQLMVDRARTQKLLEKLLHKRKIGPSEEKILTLFSSENLALKDNELEFFHFILKEISVIQLDLQDNKDTSEYLNNLPSRHRRMESLRHAFLSVDISKCLNAFIADNYKCEDKLKSFHEKVAASNDKLEKNDGHRGIRFFGENEIGVL